MFQPLALDPLTIMLHLESERRTLSASRRRTELLAESFLSGYAPLPVVPAAVLAICETLLRVMAVWGCLSNPAVRFHRRIEARLHLKTNIRWLRNPGQSLLWPSQSTK